MHPNNYRHFYRAIFCAAFAFLEMSGSDAQEKPSRQQTRNIKTTQLRTVILPGTRYEIVAGRSISFADASGEDLLSAMVTWLATNFGLSAIHERPRVEFVEPSKMAALLRRDQHSDPYAQTLLDGEDAMPPNGGRSIVALYDDGNKIIYLPKGWTGKTPVELSVLAHEMVHHLQNLAGLKYGCPEEREKLAYAAQTRWLGLFGRTLATEFQMDPFTVFVRSNCLS
jgi:hypothetical protein